jgi:hypothetical protein
MIVKAYHVSVAGDDLNPGTPEQPFRSISRAAEIAGPGDTVTVHAGTYREWVNPKRGGESDSNRITYQAAEGEEVIIKGSEVITAWERHEGSVWKTVIPNRFFGRYNPYRDVVGGDWFLPEGRVNHTGEVYLDGRSLFEVPRSGRLYLFYNKNTGIVDIRRDITGELRFVCSDDDGITWSEPHVLPMRRVSADHPKPEVRDYSLAWGKKVRRHAGMMLLSPENRTGEVRK